MEQVEDAVIIMPEPIPVNDDMTLEERKKIYDDRMDILGDALKQVDEKKNPKAANKILRSFLKVHRNGMQKDILYLHKMDRKNSRMPKLVPKDIINFKRLVDGKPCETVILL